MRATKKFRDLLNQRMEDLCLKRTNLARKTTFNYYDFMCVYKGKKRITDKFLHNLSIAIMIDESYIRGLLK